MLSNLSKVSAATLLALCASSSMAANDEVRYIIQFKSDFVHGKSQVSQAGGKIAREMKKSNAIAAILNPGQLTRMQNNPSVDYVEIDAKRYPLAFSDSAGDPNAIEVTPYGIPMVQADQLSYSGGAKVCIIDSGLDQSQYDFNWSNISGTSDPGGAGNWNNDTNHHGTHVAGTVAALGGNGIGVVGVNDNGSIPLHIVKVFDENGWAYSSDLAAAAQECADNGANVISMSLGGSLKSRTEDKKFQSLDSQGILSIAAAGNDGNNRQSYPASYNSVMSIGALDSNSVIATFSQHTNQVELSAPGVSVLSTQPVGTGIKALANVDGSNYAVGGMENLGTAAGDLYDFATGEVEDNGANGKVCLIQRGTISFHDKVLNCENSGGVGAIIYNNEAGLFYGTLGVDNLTQIPAVSASDTDGAAMLLQLGTTASIEVGPSDFAYYDGTSMATPHVSGVAALVWSNHVACSNQNIRDAMNATAVDLGDPGRDDYYGNGLVQAKAASDWLGTDCGASHGGSGGGGGGGGGGHCKGGPKNCN